MARLEEANQWPSQNKTQTCYLFFLFPLVCLYTVPPYIYPCCKTCLIYPADWYMYLDSDLDEAKMKEKARLFHDSFLSKVLTTLKHILLLMQIVGYWNFCNEEKFMRCHTYAANAHWIYSSAAGWNKPEYWFTVSCFSYLCYWKAWWWHRLIDLVGVLSCAAQYQKTWGSS